MKSRRMESTERTYIPTDGVDHCVHKQLGVPMLELTTNSQRGDDANTPTSSSSPPPLPTVPPPASPLPPYSAINTMSTDRSHRHDADTNPFHYVTQSIDE